MRSGAAILVAALCWAPAVLAADSLSQALQGQQWPTVLSTLQHSKQMPDATRREPLLYRQLQQMLNTPVDDPALQRWIGELRDYRAVLQRPANPEHPGSPLTDSYPIAELASQLLSHWQTLAKAQQLQQRWRTGDLAVPAELDALTAAVEMAEPALLEALISAHAKLPTPVLAVIARRLEQPEVYRRWLMQASDAEAISALPGLADALGPVATRELLQTLRARPALRGPVSLTLATLPIVNDQEIAILIQQLGDARSGTSSARALAQLDPDTWVRLLPEPATATAWRNTLLALHWSDQAAARALLGQWLAKGDMPEHMRTEMSQWQR